MKAHFEGQISILLDKVDKLEILAAEREKLANDNNTRAILAEKE